MKILGWEGAKVIVRHDLEDEQAVNARFLEANIHRRQLDPLGRVRLARKRYEVMGEAIASGKGKEEAKEKIAQELNMTVRNLNRYLRVADTPPAVQAACSPDGLSITLAGKVVGLSEAAQQAIAERISAGEAAQAVISEALSAAGAGKAASKPKSNLIPSVRAVIGACRKLPAKSKKLSARDRKKVETARDYLSQLLNDAAA
jgi:hypothetical protein